MRKLISFIAFAVIACNSTPASKTTTSASTAPPPEPAPSATASTTAASSATVTASADPLEVEAKREWEKDQHVDIVYVPTPQKVVDKMLEVAKVTSSDVVYDLGCGDGRIVVTSAKKGAK